MLRILANTFSVENYSYLSDSIGLLVADLRILIDAIMTAIRIKEINGIRTVPRPIVLYTEKIEAINESIAKYDKTAPISEAISNSQKNCLFISTSI